MTSQRSAVAEGLSPIEKVSFRLRCKENTGIIRKRKGKKENERERENSREKESKEEKRGEREEQHLCQVLRHLPECFTRFSP